MPPVVSVVMPTYNRRDRLDRVLNALAVQTIPPDLFEVIVVSDGSTDGTDEYLHGGQSPLDIVAVSQSNGGPGAARNRGVQLARGEIILFVDDDVAASPELVEQHLLSHQEGGGDDRLIVVGPMLSPADFVLSAWINWEQDNLQKQYDAMQRGDWAPTFRQFYTGNVSLPREMILGAGGFDTRFRRAEDVELAYRLHEDGCRFEFNPRAIGWHYAERSFESWLGNARDYGVTDVIFARDHGWTCFLDFVHDEFPKRNRFIRWTVRASVTRPRLAPAVQAVLNAGARQSVRVGATGPARALLSATYNLAYYRGIADELGGPRSFEERILAADGSR
jgi:glycosyltransferase involved in cell wall biosynthesis